jgi:hypothetical protein
MLGCAISHARATLAGETSHLIECGENSQAACAEIFLDDAFPARAFCGVRGRTVFSGEKSRCEREVVDDADLIDPKGARTQPRVHMLPLTDGTFEIDKRRLDAVQLTREKASAMGKRTTCWLLDLCGCLAPMTARGCERRRFRNW